MSSLVMISGTVSGNVLVTDDKAQFALRNGVGTFFVKVSDLKQVRVCQTLRRDGEVSVVGLLRSFVSRRCTSHHVYIEATMIVPFDVLQEAEVRILRDKTFLVGFELPGDWGERGVDTPPDLLAPDEEEIEGEK